MSRRPEDIFRFDDLNLSVEDLQTSLKQIRDLVDDQWMTVSKREIIFYELDKLSHCISQIENLIKKS